MGLRREASGDVEDIVGCAGVGVADAGGFAEAIVGKVGDDGTGVRYRLHVAESKKCTFKNHFSEDNLLFL